MALWWRSRIQLATADVIEVNVGYDAIRMSKHLLWQLSVSGFLKIDRVWQIWISHHALDSRSSSIAHSGRHYRALIAEPRASGVSDFPLWYPALIFALAGVASLRLGRRFTLRSAIIATTVVAGLLGMAVIL